MSAKVVHVHEPDLLSPAEVEQLYQRLVHAVPIANELRLPDLLGIAIRESTDINLVQVVVQPTEGSLDDVVKLPEMDATGTTRRRQMAGSIRASVTRI